MTRAEAAAVLKISVDATDDDIKEAYRKLAKANHPDLNPGDVVKEALFKEANEAAEVMRSAGTDGLVLEDLYKAFYQDLRDLNEEMYKDSIKMQKLYDKFASFFSVIMGIQIGAVVGVVILSVLGKDTQGIVLGTVAGVATGIPGGLLTKKIMGRQKTKRK